jgi:hypothetical protein
LTIAEEGGEFIMHDLPAGSSNSKLQRILLSGD